MKGIESPMAFTCGFIMGLFVAFVVVLLGMVASCAGGM